MAGPSQGTMIATHDYYCVDCGRKEHIEIDWGVFENRRKYKMWPIRWPMKWDDCECGGELLDIPVLHHLGGVDK